MASSEVIASSRPIYQVCSSNRCGRYLLYQDYINILVQAGVSIDRLYQDLFMTDSCCALQIREEAPEPDQEYVDRLDALKSITLTSPPPFYRTRREGPVRPSYSPTGGRPTDLFLGAEPYYYLVEIGEDPVNVLRRMQIDDPRDIDAILAVTDQPESGFMCPACSEHIPHFKFASYVYMRNEPEHVHLASPDRLRPCCVEAVSNVVLDRRDEDAIRTYIASRPPLESGLPIEHDPMEFCMSCGGAGVDLYHEYSWMVHRGVPSSIALNYFGLYRVCCRGSMMNPPIRVLPSVAVIERAERQRAGVPPETAIDYDYDRVLLPSLRGSI